MPRLVLTRRAQEQLTGLPEPLRSAVANTIDKIAADATLVGKPLLGRLRGLWSARVGSYRIMYTIEKAGTAKSVVIRSIRHRAVAYRRPRHR